MKNAEWMLEQNMDFSKLVWGHIDGENIVYYITGSFTLRENDALPENATKVLYTEKSDTPDNIILKWLNQEHVEKILTDEEREYLLGVIKPFMNKVAYIGKMRTINIDGYCALRIEFNGLSDTMIFPLFCEDAMYKGMKTGHYYTPKELGL